MGGPRDGRDGEPRAKGAGEAGVGTGAEDGFAEGCLGGCHFGEGRARVAGVEVGGGRVEGVGFGLGGVVVGHDGGVGNVVDRGG